MKFFPYICNRVVLDTGMCESINESMAFGKVENVYLLLSNLMHGVNYTIDGEPFSQIIKQEQL